MSNEPEAVLLEYLASNDNHNNNNDAIHRVVCDGCGRSRSMFCPMCLKLLMLPPPKLQLPFDLDIILDDRRETATGVQVKILLQESCRLIEYNREEPNEEKAQEALETMYNNDKDDMKGTYLLYPGEDSIPLNQLTPSDVTRLVVLDCKWTRSSLRFHKNLQRLPKVHLVNAPRHSQYWRWHTAGTGMLSTIEAIYYSAWELSQQQQQQQSLCHLFWIFRMQHQMIRRHHANGTVRQDPFRPKAPPFDIEQKEFQRRRRARKQESVES